MDNSTQNNFFTNDPNTESSIKFDQLIKTILEKEFSSRNHCLNICIFNCHNIFSKTNMGRFIQIVLSTMNQILFPSFGAAIINSQPGLKD